MADRSAYIKTFVAQLERWDAELDTLEKRGQSVAADAKAEYKQQIRDLQRKKATVKREMEALKRAGDDAWESMTSRTEEALKDMNKALQSVLSRFS